jgi:Domain of unknown function DUF1829
VIPKSKNQPERILQAVNRPTKDTAESLIYKWNDTRGARQNDSKTYAILNDTDAKPLNSAVIDAFRNYGIRPIPWSQRFEVTTELAA